MAATKRQLNWTTVGFTPTSGSLSTATGVTSVKIDTGGNLLKFSGDNNRFNTLVVNDFNEPMATVSLADLAWALGYPPGTVGSFTATHKDALGATGGDIVYVLNPAIVGAPSASGEHRQYGTADIDFNGISTDGSTNPLSYTRS